MLNNLVCNNYVQCWRAGVEYKGDHWITRKWAWLLHLSSISYEWLSLGHFLSHLKHLKIYYPSVLKNSGSLNCVYVF